MAPLGAVAVEELSRTAWTQRRRKESRQKAEQQVAKKGLEQPPGSEAPRDLMARRGGPGKAKRKVCLVRLEQDWQEYQQR